MECTDHERRNQKDAGGPAEKMFMRETGCIRRTRRKNRQMQRMLRNLFMDLQYTKSKGATMTETDYANIVIAKEAAERAWMQDPQNNELFEAYYDLCQLRNLALRERQEQAMREKHPVVQFEREPDTCAGAQCQCEGLL